MILVRLVGRGLLALVVGALVLGLVGGTPGRGRSEPDVVTRATDVLEVFTSFGKGLVVSLTDPVEQPHSERAGRAQRLVGPAN